MKTTGIVFCFFAIACSYQNIEPIVLNDEYLVAYNDSGPGYSDLGLIGPDSRQTANFTLEGQLKDNGSEVQPDVSDVVQSTDKVYVLSSQSRIVLELDKTTLQFVRTLPFGRPQVFKGHTYPRVQLSGNNLIVADNSINGQQEKSSLKVINLSTGKVDSVFIANASAPWITIKGNRIFVASGTSVFAFDATSFAKLAEIGNVTDGDCVGMIAGSGDDLHVLSGLILTTLNAESLQKVRRITIRETAIDSGSSAFLLWSRESSYFTIDTVNNVLYFYERVSNSTALKRCDLTTGQVEVVTTGYSGITAITLNEKGPYITLLRPRASKTDIIILDTRGVQRAQIDAPDNAYRLLIRR